MREREGEGMLIDNARMTMDELRMTIDDDD